MNEGTVPSEKDAWDAIVTSLGGRMVTWNISLHGDLAMYAAREEGKSLFHHFACKTVIILNSTIHGRCRGRALCFLVI